MYQNHFQMMDMRTIHNSSETIPSLNLITDNSQYQDNISFFPNITLFHRRGAKRLVSKKNVFNILSLISDSISSVFYKCLVKILLEDNYCYVLLSDKMCWELSELLTILLLLNYRCYKQIY